MAVTSFAMGDAPAQISSTTPARPGGNQPALKIADNAVYNVNLTLADGSANILDASGPSGATGLQKGNDYKAAATVGALTIGSTQILASDKVNVNLHTVYAHWS